MQLLLLLCHAVGNTFIGAQSVFFSIAAHYSYYYFVLFVLFIYAISTMQMATYLSFVLYYIKAQIDVCISFGLSQKYRSPCICHETAHMRLIVRRRPCEFYCIYRFLPQFEWDKSISHQPSKLYYTPKLTICFTIRVKLHCVIIAKIQMSIRFKSYGCV